MLNFKRKTHVVAVILMLLTVIFIFTRSLKSPEESRAESDTVADTVTDVVVSVIGDETPRQQEASMKASAFIENNIRKIAHLVEFAVLGAEAAVLLLLLRRDGVVKRRRICLACAIFFGVLVASADESLQLLSHRGASPTDVFIDTVGYLALLLPLHYILNFLHNKRISRA